MDKEIVYLVVLDFVTETRMDRSDTHWSVSVKSLLVYTK